MLNELLISHSQTSTNLLCIGGHFIGTTTSLLFSHCCLCSFCSAQSFFSSWCHTHTHTHRQPSVCVCFVRHNDFSTSFTFYVRFVQIITTNAYAAGYMRHFCALASNVLFSTTENLLPIALDSHVKRFSFPLFYN